MADNAPNPKIQLSWGEIMDKISILEIKEKRLKSPVAVANVRRELAVLVEATSALYSSSQLVPLRKELKLVNEALWEIEDEIREKEAAQSFDARFIELARSVYIRNDKRTALKRRINKAMHSEIVEEKQYSQYYTDARDPRAENLEPKPSDTAADHRPLLESGNVRLKDCRHGQMMFYANDVYIGRSLDLYGEFSEGEIDFFRQCLRPGMIVIDVGANIGAHTVYFAQAVGSSGRVFAFEPQRVLYQMLCGNIALNGHRNVTALNAGLGAREGTILVPDVDYSLGGNFGGIALGKWKKGEEVPLRTLDSVNLKACHLIKIDAEGMELAVLEGAKSVLEHHRPLLYVENDRAENSKALIERLFTADYRLFWHLPRMFNPKNYFAESRNVFGNTASINMLCVPRAFNVVIQGLREIASPEDHWRIPP